MARFVVGDIHGNFYGLDDVLKKAGFNDEEDLLVCIGDIVDGVPDVKRTIERLRRIKNLILVRGNHDDWAIRYSEGDLLGHEENEWRSHGGEGTLQSYEEHNVDFNRDMKFLKEKSEFLYVLDNNLFVHGGIDLESPLTEQVAYYLMWDRKIFRAALKGENTTYRGYNIFIGHTELRRSGYDTPQVRGNVVLLDTGSGSCGKLSIMDIDSLDYYQSKRTLDYYPHYSFGLNVQKYLDNNTTENFDSL